MSSFGGGAKNPPWARNVSVPTAGGQGLGATSLAGQVNSQVLAQPGVVASPTVYSLGNTQALQQTQYAPQPTQQMSAVGLGQVPVTTVTPAVALPNPGIAIPTTLATSQVATVSYPTPRLAQAQTKQRVFTGVVTKLHDTFGFVDEDVFFQLSCVKGNQPKVGDRVLVEATYNANMPFKWNASRIQLLPNQNPSGMGSGYGMKPSPMPPRESFGNSLNPNQYGGPPPQVPPLMSQTPQPGPGFRGNYHGDGGGMQRPDRGNNRDRGPGPGRYERDRDRHHDRPPRAPRQVSGGPPPQPERERERERDRDREREREKERRSPRKRSRSPSLRSRSPRPRSPARSRRTRIAPRYMVQIPKITLDTSVASVISLKSRYQNMYIPSDFFNASFTWTDAFPLHRSFNLNNSCSFHVMHKEVTPLEPNNAVLEPNDADHLYSAKVMLLTLPSLQDMFHKSCALTEDTTEARESFQHPTRLVQFLIGLKGKGEPMAIGGPWSPTLDGANPKEDPRVLINTAIRTTKALTGVDLSHCTQWYRFAEIRYHRPEEMHKGRLVPARVETVVLFLPDVWSCIPSRLDWEGLQAAYKKQLQVKTEDNKEDSTQEDEDEEGGSSEEKKEPSHYSELDPKTLKVTSMRHELEARGLNSKGLKSQLIARLTKALRSEQEKEEEEAEKKEEEPDEEKELENKKEREERELERQKREEEEKKRREEREKVVRERRYVLPDNPAIIIHPSTVAKSGKFDCTVMSLSVLLDYRPEDNKEHSFEVSLFAELFNEMLMRDFGFHIYKHLVSLPEPVKEEEKDKDKEKKDEKERSCSKEKEPSTKRRKTDDEEKEKSVEKDEKKKGDDDEEEMEHDGNKEDEDDDDRKKKDKEKDKDRKKDRDRDREREKEKEREKKKEKEKIKYYTADPALLLSYVYFDQTHCGYILATDVEEIIHTLGLILSRSQVKKLVQKVVTRDSVMYRKLTDKPIKESDETSTEGDKPIKEGEDVAKEEETPDEKAIEEIKVEKVEEPDEYALARGNKVLFDNPYIKEEIAEDGTVIKKEEVEAPVIEQKPTFSHSGLVNYMGAMVDISSVMQRLDKSEKTKGKLESRIKDLQEELDEMKSSFNSSEENSQKVATELQDLKTKLREQRKLSESAVSSNKKFFEVMSKSKEVLHKIFTDVEDVLSTAVDSKKSSPRAEPKENGDG